MGDEKRGLYGKYHVRRRDGSSRHDGEHEHCDYFVLDLTHDTYATAALYAYSEACRDDDPTLADELWALADEIHAKREGS